MTKLHTAIARGLRRLRATASHHVTRAEVYADLYTLDGGEVAPGDWKTVLDDFDDAIKRIQGEGGSYTLGVLAHLSRGRDEVWRKYTATKSSATEVPELPKTRPVQAALKAANAGGINQCR